MAVGTYGVSFGALAVSAGLSVMQTSALSILMFTGASQFAFVGIIASGGGLLPAIGTAWLLGLRNGLYALRIAPLLALPVRTRAVAAHLTIDESTAVALSNEGAAGIPEHRAGSPRTGDPAAALGFWSTGLAVFVLWNLATLIGAVLIDRLHGTVWGDPRRLGLDTAVAAAFLALLWPRLAQRSSQSLAAGAAGLALLLTPVLRPGLPVLAAALLVPAWLAVQAAWVSCSGGSSSSGNGRGGSGPGSGAEGEP